MIRKIHKPLTDLIVNKLDAGKAEQISILDVRRLSGFADVMIIATGTSTRHVMSLAHHLTEELKENGFRPLSDPETGTGHWVVVDLGAVLVHLMTAEARQTYALEDLWQVPKSTRKKTRAN